jgi:hypothetical protein
VQALLGGHRQAAFLGNGNEVSEMAQLHRPYLAGMAGRVTKSFR